MSYEQDKDDGWVIPNLMELLKSELISESRTLSDYVQKNPLASINQNKDKFVIIRKFSSRIFDEKVDMLNQNSAEGSEHYPISHYGMTLIFASAEYSRSYNVYLPNSLIYKSVKLLHDKIIINDSKGATVTNFDEINKLRTFPKLMESEILREYEKLSNRLKLPEEIDRQNTPEIKNSFFGTLVLNDLKETYDSEFEFHDASIIVSLSNSTKEINEINLKNAEDVFAEIQSSEKIMITELCELKNRAWLDEDEKSLGMVEIKGNIRLFGCDIYQNGSISMYYKAGNLFLGHEIQMNFDSKGDYIDFSLIG